MDSKLVNITIIGTGAYGTVLANVLADNNQKVLMYGIDKGQIEDINENNLNSAFFGDQILNSNIKATSDIAFALENAEVVILGVPTGALDVTLENVIKYGKRKMHIINVAKGLDEENADVLSKKIKNKLADKNIMASYGAIYGPSVAIEVIKKRPTCVMSCNEDFEVAKWVADLFSNEYFVAYPTSDIIGCEIAAALKNTIAISAGLLDGLTGSDNSRSCLITIGLNEICKIALEFGGKIETFLNFATIGDLILTSTSYKSRNYSLGMEIAKNRSDTKSVLKSHKKTVEGVLTCKVANEIIKKNGIKSPLFEIMYEILYNNVKPDALLSSLFNKAKVV